MFCIYCGAPNPENASFCSACGKAIGAAVDAAPMAEAASPVRGRAEESFGNATRDSAPPVWLPTQPTSQAVPQATPHAVAQPAPPAAPELQYSSTAAGKGKPVLWILAGFAACLLIVIAVAMGSRLNQNSPAAGRDNATPDAAPAAYTAPAATPAADSTPAPAADSTPAPVAETPAPASAPVEAPAVPAPAAPQNPIVGDWKATTFIGSTIGLHLGADGRYILNPGSDEGVYSYSSGDGTLRLQSNSFFSSGIMVWSCQVMGDTLSCIDPKGAGHVYNRVR